VVSRRSDGASGAAAERIEGGSIMENPQNGRRAALRGRRGIVLIVASALTLGLGVTGVYALTSGSSSSGERSDRAATSTPTAPAPTTTVTPSPSPATPRPSPTSQPTPDPSALADGVYPAFVRAVDPHGATVTVDVLQIFVGADAHQAAIEDGVPWNDVRFDPVYIRNENPLLRTLPVASDAHIKLLGTCEAPNRSIALKQLRNETTPFTDAFYYEVSVAGGNVVGIVQKIAISAC
jgi:hypothetical protein